jgi:WD40 repeat protein
MRATHTGEKLSPLVRATELSGALAWSAAGDLLACGIQSNDGRPILIFDRQLNKLRSLEHPGSVASVDFAPHGHLLASIGQQCLRIHDARDALEIATVDLPSLGTAVVFSHNGTRLAYGMESNPAVLVSYPLLAVTHELKGSDGTACMAFSPDDQNLATGHSDGTIRIWDVSSGTLRLRLSAHEHGLNDVAYSPDGETLVSSSKDGTVRLWSVKHGAEFGVFFRERQPLTHHPRQLYMRFSLSNDGEWLAIGTPNSDYHYDLHVVRVPGGAQRKASGIIESLGR